MVAERNLEDISRAVPIAAQDAQRLGDLRPGGDRLDVLSDPADADSGQLLKLPEQRVRAKI